jgi:hypothetical protein
MHTTVSLVGNERTEKGLFFCCTVIKKWETKTNDQEKKTKIYLFSSSSSRRPPRKLRDRTAEHDRKSDHEHAAEQNREDPGVVRPVRLPPERERERERREVISYFFGFLFGGVSFRKI